ncbi:uncharacterized protein LOC142994815 isoform X3 [Genypterus blacodes]|uniref:uncharacterized protein LOC142994815 isoform X3 n=1 Tax=Genypterus blacodes TaxID=154954 RepID=UPI003F764578
MDGMFICLAFVFGAVSSSHGWIPGLVSDPTVKPGGNITLYCDCKLSTGVYIAWYRNCSHENQPRLVLRTAYEALFHSRDIEDVLNPFPRFHLVRNHSTETYDLLIVNLTESDEGLYYCGNEHNTVLIDEEKIALGSFYRYGNVTTRILLNPAGPGPCPSASWMQRLSPGLTVLSSVLCFVLIYCIHQLTANEPQLHQNTTHTRGQTNRIPDEDLCLTQVEFWAVEGKTHSSTEARMYKLTR